MISRESLLEHEYGELETELPDWTGAHTSAPGASEPAAPPPRRHVERETELPPDEAFARERTRAAHARVIACLALAAATLAGIVALEQRAVIITRGGRIDEIRNRRCVDDSSGGVFASPAASYERLSHFVDVGLPASVGAPLTRWAIAAAARRAAGGGGATSCSARPNTWSTRSTRCRDGRRAKPVHARRTRGAAARMRTAADVAEWGGAPFVDSFSPADAGAALYAWRRALYNASWPDPAYMRSSRRSRLFVCTAACGADGRVSPAAALARLTASDASARASTEDACTALLAADGERGRRSPRGGYRDGDRTAHIPRACE